MRLIDADDAKKIIDNIDTFCGGWRAYAMEQIDNAPTVDAIEVVRCKDCVFCWKYNDKYYLPKKDTLLCINDDIEVEADDFCSWGERRKDEID